jgi:hypothetical protein
MPETPTFGRYAERPYDQMTPEQREGYRALIETCGAVGGPSKIWVHNPKLAKVMGPLGAHFRTGYSLSEGEREIAARQSRGALIRSADLVLRYALRHLPPACGRVRCTVSGRPR